MRPLGSRVYGFFLLLFFSFLFLFAFDVFFSLLDLNGRTHGNTKTVMLDVETNDNFDDEKMWTSWRHQRQQNVNDPSHEKLVEEIVEVVQIISHISEHNANCLTVTFSSIRVAPRK